MRTESDRDMIFRLTMRVKLLEAECASLQMDLDAKSMALAEANDARAFLKDRNATLSRRVEDLAEKLNRMEAREGQP